MITKEMQRRFELLKAEEERNITKKIAEDWQKRVFPEYKFFKEYGLTCEESRICSLLMTGYYTMGDLK